MLFSPPQLLRRPRNIPLKSAMNFSAHSPFVSTTIVFPRAGARALRIEKVKNRPMAPKTGQFGLSAEPRPLAQSVRLLIAPPPAAANLYVQTPQGLVRSEAFEDWLEQSTKRLAAQRPGRLGATYALEVQAPRTARTKHFGALERPLVELLARARIIRRGLSPDRFSASYGGAGSQLSLTLSDFSAP